MSGVTSIKINNEVHSTGDTFSLSAGMNAMVTMNYFKIIDKELCVAFPVVLFDMLEGGTIEANGVTLNYAANDYDTAKIEKVRGQKSSGSKITVTEDTSNSYNVTHADGEAHEWLEIVIEGLDANTMMVTKKIYSKENGDKTTDYGFTDSDPSEWEDKAFVLAFYAFGWGSTPGHDGETCEYQAYLVGTNRTEKLTLNLKCQKSSS